MNCRVYVYVDDAVKVLIETPGGKEQSISDAQRTISDYFLAIKDAVQRIRGRGYKTVEIILSDKEIAKKIRKGGIQEPDAVNYDAMMAQLRSLERYKIAVVPPSRNMARYLRR